MCNILHIYLTTSRHATYFTYKPNKKNQEGNLKRGKCKETVGICKLVFSSSSYHMWHLHMATKQETCFEFTGLSHLLMISGYQLTAQIDSKSSRWL